MGAKLTGDHGATGERRGLGDPIGETLVAYLNRALSTLWIRVIKKFRCLRELFFVKTDLQFLNQIAPGFIIFCDLFG